MLTGKHERMLGCDMFTGKHERNLQASLVWEQERQLVIYTPHEVMAWRVWYLYGVIGLVAENSGRCINHSLASNMA